MQNINQQGQPEIPQLNIDPRELQWVGCSKGTQLYQTATLYKRLPQLLSPTGKEEMLPAEIPICMACGKIPKFVWDKYTDIPENMRSNCDTTE